MKLLQPNPGEAIDRQTILEIKLEHAEDVKLKDGTGAINGTHWVDEHRAIQKYLETNWYLLTPTSMGKTINELMAQLKEVNKTLWKAWTAAQGDLRPPLETGDKTLAQYMAAYNLHRANLVQQINKLFGITTQEKL